MCRRLLRRYGQSAGEGWEAIDLAFSELEGQERTESLSPVRVDSLGTHALSPSMRSLSRHALSPSMRSLSRGSHTPARSWSRVLSSQSSKSGPGMTSVASMYTNEAFELDLDDPVVEEQIVTLSSARRLQL